MSNLDRVLNQAKKGKHISTEMSENTDSSDDDFGLFSRLQDDSSLYSIMFKDKK